MDVLTAKKTFPCYKDEQGVIIFSRENIPLCAREIERKNVYRICFNGIIDEEAFECTYVSFKRRNRVLRERDLKKPGCFATSCFSSKNDILIKKEAWGKNNPLMIIAVGNILEESGLSCTDNDLESNGKASHINWWIYLESEPHRQFRQLEEV